MVKQWICVRKMQSTGLTSKGSVSSESSFLSSLLHEHPSRIFISAKEMPIGFSGRIVFLLSASNDGRRMYLEDTMSIRVRSLSNGQRLFVVGMELMIGRSSFRSSYKCVFSNEDSVRQCDHFWSRFRRLDRRMAIIKRYRICGDDD
jgi:hypothetical protein